MPTGIYRKTRRLICWICPSLDNTTFLAQEFHEGTVVDIGCGKFSPASSTLKGKASYLVGVDIFKPYLFQAKKMWTHNDFVLSDAKYLPFRRKCFDYVVALEVIEHMNKREGEKLVNSLEGIARKKVIIDTPNGWVPQAEIDGNPRSFGQKFISFALRLLSDMSQLLVEGNPERAANLFCVKLVK